MPPSDIPPTHKIHLSTPPQTRYAPLATLYAPKLQNITSIFDTLVLDIFPAHYLPWIKTLARIFLRGVYDADETAEIRGIADAAGVDLYLVVCFNVLLDLLMGCTSGAALSSSSSSTGLDGRGRRGDDEGVRKMLHFRTLDWDMPALRSLLVQLEYVAPDENGIETVVATSITYVGFVGVLTAVRRGLSVSLNFRPNHDDGSWWKQLRYYSGHALVLLGFRRSISSVLRGLVVPPTATTATSTEGWLAWLSRSLTGQKETPRHNLSLGETVSKILETPSTACYLILSDGVHAYVLEKDIKTATIESSSSFIVATNDDRGTKVPSSSDFSQKGEHTGTSLLIGDAVSVGDFIKDSIERRECIQAHWDRKVARTKQAARIRLHARRDPLRRTRSSRREDIAAVSSSVSADVSSVATDSEVEVTATLDEIVAWTSKFPTTNEMTHFSTVMDPVKGDVVWIRRYPEPLDDELTDSE